MVPSSFLSSRSTHNNRINTTKEILDNSVSLRINECPNTDWPKERKRLLTGQGTQKKVNDYQLLIIIS